MFGAPPRQEVIALQVLAWATGINLREAGTLWTSKSAQFAETTLRDILARGSESRIRTVSFRRYLLWLRKTNAVSAKSRGSESRLNVSFTRQLSH
jgi:hypothetical protein